MDRNLVGWFEIPVNDMVRAVKFYNKNIQIFTRHQHKAFLFILQLMIYLKFSKPSRKPEVKSFKKKSRLLPILLWDYS